MSKREDYQTKMEEQLALWGARFEALHTKAGKDVPPEIEKNFEVLSSAYKVALAQLVVLKETSGDGWDAVKEQMENAWHAIELVLNERAPAAAGGPTFTKEEIQSLSPEQQDAVLEALVVAVVADSEVGKDEIARFNAEIARIPWAQPKQAIMEKAQAAQARVMAQKTDADRAAFLKTIAARLPHGPIAEKTVGMMAMVMAADKELDVAEKNTLGIFALAFGITNERAAAIAASLRGA
jgi:hypothetical protein